MKIINIPAKSDKKSGSKNKNVFASVNNHRIMKLNTSVASAITARYYKGISADGDNLIIVRVENE